tara:strand:- start:22270 stop:23007 length:738 start_codon:yes stop_codon:yes gene_type:complete
MKAIHIDDEKDSLEVMRILLQKHCPQIDLVASVASVDAGLIALKEYQPQLVFLDIEMPSKNGFLLLDELKEYNFEVVMVTGYENYAIKAIKYAALDYLLKPLDARGLVQAVKKAEASNGASTDRLIHYRSLVSEAEDTYNSLMISSKDGYRVIDINDLLCLKSESGSYCVMYFTDGSKEVVSKPLNYFEALLPAEFFYRIHRSHLVNLKKVTSFDAKSSKVKLAGDIELVVSTRKKADFRKKMTN